MYKKSPQLLVNTFKLLFQFCNRFLSNQALYLEFINKCVYDKSWIRLSAESMIVKLNFWVISLAVHVVIPSVRRHSLFEATSSLIHRNFGFCSIFKSYYISIHQLFDMAIHLFSKRLFCNHTSFQEANQLSRSLNRW